jgi:short-subunit dehydrogenase
VFDGDNREVFGAMPEMQTRPAHFLNPARQPSGRRLDRVNSMNSNAAIKGTAVVTGASAGIGMVYADRLAAQGYDLILVARRAERLNELAKRLSEQYGIHATALVEDLSKDAGVAAVEAAITADPTITMLVNNAGVATLAGFADTDFSKHEAMIDLNVNALVRLCYAVLPLFKQRDNGVLINIGSVLSLHTLPISSVYSGTKAYVTSFTRGLQQEVEGTNVKVQLVMPSATDTEIWDIAGVPVENLGKERVMSVDNLVDAALAGLAKGEAVTLPSVEDIRLWEEYDAAREKLFEATQSGKPASRYNIR